MSPRQSRIRATICVAIIEDQRRTREGLRWLIERSAGFECVVDWGSIEEALAAPKPAKLNVILLDIGLLGMSGIQGIGPLKEIYFETPIVVLTVYQDNEKVFHALCAGASGYLLKNTPPGEAHRSAA